MSSGQYIDILRRYKILIALRNKTSIDFFQLQEKEKERKKRMEAEKSKRKPVVDMNAGLYTNCDSVLSKRANIVGKLCQSAMLINYLFPSALFTACMFSRAWHCYVICFLAL